MVSYRDFFVFKIKDVNGLVSDARVGNIHANSTARKEAMILLKSNKYEHVQIFKTRVTMDSFRRPKERIVFNGYNNLNMMTGKREIIITLDYLK